MAEFKEILLERIRAQYAVRDAPGQNGYGVEFKNAALFGAKAALELAAETAIHHVKVGDYFSNVKRDEPAVLSCNLLSLARELEDGRG